MENILVFISKIGVIVACSIIAYTLINYKKLAYSTTSKIYKKSQYSRQQLAEIEGSIINLKRVIVVSDTVEEPKDHIRKAVELNLARDVRYIFLVSQSKASAEIKGYFGIFMAIRDKVERDTDKNLNESVDIQQLPHEWNDVPYIFYQSWKEGDRANRFTIAFRGSEEKTGLSEYYERIEKKIAKSLAMAILQEAPTPILIDNHEFSSAPDQINKIIDLRKKKQMRSNR